MKFYSNLSEISAEDAAICLLLLPSFIYLINGLDFNYETLIDFDTPITHNGPPSGNDPYIMCQV